MVWAEFQLWSFLGMVLMRSSMADRRAACRMRIRLSFPIFVSRYGLCIRRATTKVMIIPTSELPTRRLCYLVAGSSMLGSEAEKRQPKK